MIRVIVLLLPLAVMAGSEFSIDAGSYPSEFSVDGKVHNQPKKSALKKKETVKVEKKVVQKKVQKKSAPKVKRTPYEETMMKMQEEHGEKVVFLRTLNYAKSYLKNNPGLKPKSKKLNAKYDRMRSNEIKSSAVTLVIVSKSSTQKNPRFDFYSFK